MAKRLKTTEFSRMKVHSDSEQTIEHLLHVVKSMCLVDMMVKRALIKSHESQGHVKRAV